MVKKKKKKKPDDNFLSISITLEGACFGKINIVAI